MPVLRALLLSLLFFASSACAADTTVVSPKGLWLAGRLDSMGVEGKWIAGAHIDWETGMPDGRPERLPGKHTHCSAFVASVAKTLRVYILRPPEHGQILLANAQNEWLAREGAARGWRKISSALEAQALANSGVLVVASYHNHRDDKPGHIAIVRPSAVTPAEIESVGPTLIQAGSVNSAAISAREGFAGHVHAWRDGEIDYYAHEVPDAQ
jgi:hypothetical protein